MRPARFSSRPIAALAAAALAAFPPLTIGAAGAESGSATISSQRAAALAVNTLEAVDGGFRLRNPNHRASFTPAAVTLSPPSGSPSWSWRLARVGPAASQVSLIGGASVTPTRPEAGVVRFERGILDEEYALEAGSIEQRFVLHAPLPLDGGDLALEGMVACDGEFRTAKQGWEWRGERGGVWLGPATVIDASGALLPSSFEVSAGATRLIVQGEALADAAYPATVTTKIRAQSLRISDMGGTGDTSYRGVAPAVAYSSINNQYLVVWSGNDNIGGLIVDEAEIFGQRIDAATGAELGANDFRISDVGGTGLINFWAWAPAVAYNSTDDEYLVVWYGNDNEGGLSELEWEIFGQRIDAATGSAVGANDFRISDMGGDWDPAYHADDPAVAYNGALNEYLVVWSGYDNVGGLVSGEAEIFVQLLDAATGAQIGYNDLRISDMGGTGNGLYDASAPAVAYNSSDDRYLVVWSGDDNVSGMVNDELEIFAELLDADSLAPLAANDFRVSDMGGAGDADFDAETPAVAYDGVNNQFLVVWSGEDDVGGLVDDEFEIFGQRIDAETGAAVGANDFRISDMGDTGYITHGAFAPAVAHDAIKNEFLVVWTGDDDVGGLIDEELEVFGQRLDGATGVAVGMNDFRISEMGGTGDPNFDADLPAVAWAGAAGQYLATWNGDDNAGGLVQGEYEIFGKLLGVLPFEDGFESGDTAAWSTTVP
jgi:hypothetical protein